MYREPFKTRRCIVPATGHIEFTGPKADKTAHLFTRADGKPFALGGLWDRWTSADKSENKKTYTVVTTAPSAFAGRFHDRMPLVLEMEDVEGWLTASPDHAATLMRPAKDVLQERPLGRAINNVKNNSPELLAEMAYLGGQAMLRQHVYVRPGAPTCEVRRGCCGLHFRS